MNEEEIKKIARETFIENVMNNLDSAIIFKYIQELEQENARLKDKIDESIEYIRDCCDMDSKWVNLHYDYAQKEMSSNEVDRLLEILKEN